MRAALLPWVCYSTLSDDLSGCDSSFTMGIPDEAEPNDWRLCCCPFTMGPVAALASDDLSGYDSFTITVLLAKVADNLSGVAYLRPRCCYYWKACAAD